MNGRPTTLLLPLVLATTLSACGTYVPQLHEAWEPADVSDPSLVQRIKQSIYCELRTAVYNQKGQAATANPGGEAIPNDWGAQITLTLQVDESGSISPGATWNRSLGGTDLFTLGGGATISSDASRIDKYYSYFSAIQLKQNLGSPDTSCMEFDESGHLVALDRRGSTPLISGKLGIEAWLKGALIQQNAIPSSPELKGSFKKLEVLSYDVKFTIVTSASITPTWKFVTFTAGASGGTFASAGRTRTHELLLTLGPADIAVVPEKGKKKLVSAPSGAAQNVHFASEIGQAVAGALRATTPAR